MNKIIFSLFQMMNCISGMVEKTQRAISILQQRQAEVSSIRAAEELVEEVQSNAAIAIMEVKQAALEETTQAESERKKMVSDVQTNAKEEVVILSLIFYSINVISFFKSCWNCGRQATEHCSGCSLARYCGPFCQHKDWEDHARVCRPDLTMEDQSRQQRGMAGSPPPRDRRADSQSRKE